MRKGEATRERILQRAAALFNQKGYAGASMADLMEATGLQKGGLYRHFESKEALAVDALDYALSRLADRLTGAAGRNPNAVDRILALFESYGSLLEDPPVAGGSPLMNAAVENDHGNPALRGRVLAGVDGLWAYVERTIRSGRERGEVRNEVDSAEVATVVISLAEGALVLSQLYGSGAPLHKATLFIRRYLEEHVRTNAALTVS